MKKGIGMSGKGDGREPGVGGATRAAKPRTDGKDEERRAEGKLEAGKQLVNEAGGGTTDSRWSER